QRRCIGQAHIEQNESMVSLSNHSATANILQQAQDACPEFIERLASAEAYNMSLTTTLGSLLDLLPMTKSKMRIAA
ncbi:MAG: hypothetical protein ABI874_07685, partial [Chloroflexota bacterium]